MIITYQCPNGHIKNWSDPGGGCMVRRRIICSKCGEWAEQQSDNPFEPNETREQQDARVGKMIRDNVDKRLGKNETHR